MSLLYHYTTLERLAQILDAGILAPSRYLDSSARPTLWFSSNPVYEHTARKRCGLRNPDGSVSLMSRRLTFEEQHEVLGHARIGVDLLDLMDYARWGELSGVGCTDFESLALGGLQLGALPTEWFATFEAVPSSQWVGIEVWDGREWQDTQDLAERVGLTPSGQ
jgi:hypothetical protein